MRFRSAVLSGVLLAASVAFGADVSFTTKPAATKAGEKVKITFAVSAPCDVEVAVVAGDGKVVRHLAAGVLGGAKAPPEPLKAGLSQALEWDLKDDFGKPAAATGEGGAFSFRVRAGCGAKFGRFIGEDPYNFGAIDAVVADEDGKVYIKGYGGEANQAAMNVRQFDAQGRYVREVLPFPADLPPEATKDVARWDEGRKAFCPRNYKNLNPEFYVPSRGGNLALVAATKKDGLIFTDGSSVYRIDARGAVPEAAFATQTFWAKDARNPNTGDAPVFLAASPDGQYLYLSGPFSSKTKYGHEYKNKFPPGRVYRMKAGGAETMQPFVTVDVDHFEGQGGAWVEHNPRNHGVSEGPIHGLAVDAKGNVYLADRENQRVVAFDKDGKEAGQVALANPHQIAIHPATGEVYVLCRTCTGYWQYKVAVCKFKAFAGAAGAAGAGAAEPVARYEFPVQKTAFPQMALASYGGQPTVLVTGVPGNFVALADKGATFDVTPTQFAAKGDLPVDWNRLAVDFARDEIYISNGTTRMWRFSGATGQGGILKKDGKDFLANDLAVGYDGLLYTRVSGKWNGSAADYSGPFWRLDHELEPAPYAGSGSHVLSPYVYSRFGIGFAERGIGAGPDGKVYLSFMYRFVAYAMAGFGPDGKPLKGKYLQGVFPTDKPEERKKYPPDMDSAVIGPLPQGNTNIRVDLKGNIYVGLMHRPKDFTPPAGFEKDQGYRVSVGSVVKFPPEGGTMPGKDDAVAAAEMEGAVNAYVGLAPFSSAAEAFGGNTCCVCRVPRFDLDRFGRLVLPNAMTNSVLLYDNAGNLILEFGRYGNFDSQFVNPAAEGDRKGKPVVAVPDIPLAWPTGAGFSEGHVYVNDTYSRRALRVDLTWKAEETCQVR